MTLQDLAGYACKERTPVCFAYRGYKVCGMGPPSSGGLTVRADARPSSSRFDLGKAPAAALQPQAMHLIAEAETLAYADRNRYLADPDFVAIPDGAARSAIPRRAPRADRSAARDGKAEGAACPPGGPATVRAATPRASAPGRATSPSSTMTATRSR